MAHRLLSLAGGKSSMPLALASGGEESTPATATAPPATVVATEPRNRRRGSTLSEDVPA